MDIEPIGPRVLLKPIKAESKTKGGIFIPDSAKEERKMGEVVAVGTSTDGAMLPIAVGDKVLYGGFSVDEFDFEGKRYKMVEFKDILAKVKK